VAQQIVIDIVAETKKLTEGLNDANKQLGTVNGKLKGVAKAATAAASAFVLKQGISCSGSNAWSNHYIWRGICSIKKDY
jgi:hypothetical protein